MMTECKALDAQAARRDLGSFSLVGRTQDRQRHKLKRTSKEQFVGGGGKGGIERRSYGLVGRGGGGESKRGMRME